MKKSLLTATLLVPMMALGQTATIISPESAIEYGGTMCIAMSENGQYIAGSTQQYAGFIMDLNDGTILFDEPLDDFGCEVRGVSNTGIGVGMNGNSAPSIDFATGEKTDLETPEGFVSIANGISPDGSIIVGLYYSAETYVEKPCYWDADGTLHELPEANEEELGFEYNGSRAVAVSDDGKTIVGYVIDNFAGNPPIIWRLDEDETSDTFGQWVYDIAIILDKFEPGYGDKPYYQMTPTCISHNGKYVAVTLTMNNENSSNGLGLFDIEEGSFVEVPINEELQLQNAFHPASVSNNGDIVGYYGAMMSLIPFIFQNTGDESAQLQDFANFFGEEITDDGLVEVVTSPRTIPCVITADGSKIAGWAVNGDTWDTFSFIIDLNGESGVNDIAVSNNGAAGQPQVVARYNAAGMRVADNARGLNIEMMSDGSARKVLVK
ncbi:MAG: hypothetical protein ACI30W_06910 [Muribaculaceae bacterium]